MRGSALAMIFSHRANRFRDRVRIGSRRQAAPQATAFNDLPRAERRQADRQIARPLQELEGKRHLRCKPKCSTENYIGSLLHPDSVWDRKGDGADGIE